jgi:hypothetical protein
VIASLGWLSRGESVEGVFWRTGRLAIVGDKVIPNATRKPSALSIYLGFYFTFLFCALLWNREQTLFFFKANTWLNRIDFDFFKRGL